MLSNEQNESDIKIDFILLLNKLLLHLNDVFLISSKPHSWDEFFRPPLSKLQEKVEKNSHRPSHCPPCG
jgi:hypothetical protein